MNRLPTFLLRTVHGIAAIGCFALALRFLIVTQLSAENPGVSLVLAGGVAASTLWNPVATFRGLLLLFPLLFGLARMNLLAIGSAETVALAAHIIAAMARRAAIWVLRRDAGHRSGPRQRVDSAVVILADALAVLTLLSFAWWLRGMFRDGASLRPVLTQPTFGSWDRLFPVTDTMIWLIGWYFLRHLVDGTLGGSAESAPAARGPEAQAGSMDSLPGWLCLCALGWALFTMVFFVLQAWVGLADGFAYDPSFSVPTSMFNDPHTFGGVAASLSVALAIWSRDRHSRGRILSAAGAAVMLLFVFVCYSRAAWFAAAASIGVVLAAGHRRMALVLGLAVLLVMGLVAWRADDLLRLDRPYLTRIVRSVRLDRLTDNSEARLVIYRRIPAMVSARPLLGQGPGSSRVSSLPFVAPTDPIGPDFVHDAVLQAAVEQGVPAGAALLALLVLPLACAIRRPSFLRGDTVASAAAVAIFAFLLTQLTSNSLNVYLDQQIFLWTLVGLLLGRLRLARRENPPPCVEPSL